jgi:hypothetical protein
VVNGGNFTKILANFISPLTPLNQTSDVEDTVESDSMMSFSLLGQTRFYVLMRLSAVSDTAKSVSDLPATPYKRVISFKIFHLSWGGGCGGLYEVLKFLMKKNHNRRFLYLCNT